MPRRRFSQGAVSALKDILENLDVNDGERGEEKDERAMVDPEEFSSLSREEQLKVSILDYLDQAHWLSCLLSDFRAEVLG